MENELVYRDGIPIEKGVVLTKQFLDDNKDLVDAGDWDEIVGKWKKGFVKED